jgi:beta-galactosidase
MPALTINSVGAGQAYYIAFRCDVDFVTDFYRKLAADLGLKMALDTDLPSGVTVQTRTDGRRDYLFLMNFTPEDQTIALGSGGFVDKLTGDAVARSIGLKPYGVKILERAHS